MTDTTAGIADGPERSAGTPRRRRVDAQRNGGALLHAAKTVFVTSGVDAPAKEIADLAGVGVGTLYRHFPLRSDLVIAVLEHEVDGCIEAGRTLSSSNEPLEALTKWLNQYTEFVATKRGLAAALHSGDPAFDGLPAYLLRRLDPVLTELLEKAASAGAIRDDVSGDDLLRAVAHLCVTAPGEGVDFSRRMVALLVDGLRLHAPAPAEA